MTLVGFWLLGTFAVMRLSETGLLVTSVGPAEMRCAAAVDPSLFAADLMLPIIDLGQENLCKVRPASQAAVSGIAAWSGNYRLFGLEAAAGFGLALYKMLGWALVSLAIATWSGLFRRAGRD